MKMALKKVLYFVLLLMSSFGYSQLADFNLDVVATDEVCAGNGSLQMSVSNTTNGAQIFYSLYLAPDFNNPIAETTSNSFSSLQSGNYRVIATQSINGLTNSQQKDIVIQRLIVDLDFTISYTTVTACDVTGTISVNVLSGNPVSYEIISGPVIVSQQSSNEFTGLPSGTYIIRVFDGCNDALSKTFTMFLQTNNLTISPVKLPEIYDSCTSGLLKNEITPAMGTQILYPLVVTYTIHPPDGSPDQVIIQNITTGSPESLELANILPMYGDQAYDYDLLITDNCGNEFSSVNIVNPNPKVDVRLRDAPCSEYYLSLLVSGYLPPYKIYFDSAPDDFNPALLNSLFPGNYTEQEVDFGDNETPVPFGIYDVYIIDDCGRKGSVQFIIEEVELEPEVGATSSKCGLGLGLIRVIIPDDRKIVSAIITEAPPAYTEPLPSNITSYIGSNGILVASNLPDGDYTIIVVDECGYEYEIKENVPEFVILGLSASTLPNCDPGSGSVMVMSENGKLVSLNIIQAPLTYMEALPYDVSFNIDANSGYFFMSSLPAGNYTFKGVDECGFELEVPVNVIGYTTTPDGYTLTRNCGSFNLGIYDLDTTVTNQKYWFQKFFSETNSWGHPYTGANYTEGGLPNTSNSISLTNLNTVYNLFLTGNFRVIKVFESYNNGVGNTNCIDIFAEFMISDKLIINGVYNLDCKGGSSPSDIILDVIGVSPFTYSITSPFTFNNGNNNVFTGLAPGTYYFDVTDGCGNVKNIRAEVGNLLPLTRANTPESMLVCRNDDNQVGIFILSNQNLQILGNQNPNDYTVTYHLNQSDADTGNAPLVTAYTNISNPQTIYARVAHKRLDNCYATTSFPIFIGKKPVLAPTFPVILCEGTKRTLVADSGFDAYEWSTGATTQSILVEEPGIYSVTVKNVYQDFVCDNSKEFIVTGSSIATFVEVSTTDWSAGENTITVIVSGTGEYVYSLDDEIYQHENTFTNLLPGKYTVYVKDLNGCGTIYDDFTLLNYPNFFTPNGDGYNDTWNIKFASSEPNLKVDIFDRYGKFLIRLSGGGPGWDGTYNGKPLPSTDYWFVVTREDGTIHKGHFAMKR